MDSDWPAQADQSVMAASQDQPWQRLRVAIAAAVLMQKKEWMPGSSASAEGMLRLA